MNTIRIIVILIAGLAAIAAAFFVRGAMQPAAPTPAAETVERPVVVEPERVLVATRDLEAGHRLSESDMRWVNWPKEALLGSHIVRARDEEAVDRLVGAVVRGAFVDGEPMHEGRLVYAGETGFMAAVLQPGMRAVAVPTSARAGAGGFILPNDRVDVMSSFQDENGYRTDIVVENARVLAIDQSFSESGDAVVGSTATIELTSDQARAVANAVAVGSVSLALRSISDGSGGPRLPNGEGLNAGQARGTVRVFRYGQEEQVALAGGQ